MTPTVAVVDSISLTDLLIMVGILGVIVDRLADARGWSRSSRRLREENSDLLRRNAELEDTVKRHQSEIDRLKAHVAELEKTNVAAVSAQMAAHEKAASERDSRRAQEDASRHDSLIGVLTEIRDGLDNLREAA